jgi:hypothetical protein
MYGVLPSKIVSVSGREAGAGARGTASPHPWSAGGAEVALTHALENDSHLKTTIRMSFAIWLPCPLSCMGVTMGGTT